LPAAEVFEVTKTFDNHPFSCRIEPARTGDAFKVYRLHYPSPVRTSVEPNNTVPAELYMPRGAVPGGPKRPAVICLHILDGNEELVKISCSALAARGIPALWFNLPFYGPRSPTGRRIAAESDPALFTTAISQAVQDVRRTVDVLASRPEIDPHSIGVMGISLGGILAATAAENEPRINRAVLVLAGGDLLPVLYHANETRGVNDRLRRLSPERRAQIERAIREVDPLTHAGQLRSRALSGKVLMFNAGSDEVIPRACTEKLASALGIAERVHWLDGLGHYTAMAALPETMRATADFFAQDMPAGVKLPEPAKSSSSPHRVVAGLLSQLGDLLAAEPKEGHCHLADVEVSITGKDNKKMAGRLRLIVGQKPRFSIYCQLPGIAEASLGYATYPWMTDGKRVVFKGSKGDSPIFAQTKIGTVPSGDSPADAVAFGDPKQLMKLRVVAGALASASIAPDILDRWATITDDTAAGDAPAIRIVRKDRPQDYVRIVLQQDRSAPAIAEFDVEGIRGTATFHAWSFNAVAHDSMFQEPAGLPIKEVPAADLTQMFSAGLNFAAESFDKMPRAYPGQDIRVIAKDPAGHGVLCQSQGKSILIVEGTPEQMGAAHGKLLRDSISKTRERVLYLVGAGESIHSGTWCFDRFAEIERRTSPYLPGRYFAECDALARAAGLSVRDGRAANLFPERFHCSGVAVCGKATIDGRVLHARVLDYMRDIRLQDAAVVTVFMPQGRNKWISQGYAGLIGTVTAMNEKGLAIGEMGGRGEGDWDGTPMTFLLREVMERAGTVEEGLEILRRGPRTCEYYYVLSDKSRAMAAVHCDAKQITILRPGEQHPRLPHVPEDTVLVSGPDRAKTLSARLQEHYGKIDPETLIDIIKRPVAMNSNLHDAVFRPETLDLWVSDAGRSTPACDEPYAHFNLAELLRFYAKQH
jgi:dienelactone hydrolase